MMAYRFSNARAFICFLLYFHVTDALSRWDYHPVNWCIIERIETAGAKDPA